MPIHGLPAAGAVSDQRGVCMDGQRIRFLRSADVIKLQLGEFLPE